MKFTSLKITKVVAILGLLIAVLVLATLLNEALRVSFDARLAREKQVCIDAKLTPRITMEVAHYLRGGVGPRVICE